MASTKISTNISTKRTWEELDEETEDENITIKTEHEPPPFKKLKIKAINLSDITKEFHEIIYDLNDGNWLNIYLKEYKIFGFKSFPTSASKITLDFRNISMNYRNKNAINKVLIWLKNKKYFLKCKQLTIFNTANDSPFLKKELCKIIDGMNKIKKLKIVGLNMKECVGIIANINGNKNLNRLCLQNIKCDNIEINKNEYYYKNVNRFVQTISKSKCVYLNEWESNINECIFYKYLLIAVRNSKNYKNCNVNTIGYGQNDTNNITFFILKQLLMKRNNNLQKLKIFCGSFWLNALLRNAIKMYEFQCLTKLKVIFSDNELFLSDIYVVIKLMRKTKKLEMIDMIFEHKEWENISDSELKALGKCFERKRESVTLRIQKQGMIEWLKYENKLDSEATESETDE